MEGHRPENPRNYKPWPLALYMYDAPQVMSQVSVTQRVSQNLRCERNFTNFFCNLLEMHKPLPCLYYVTGICPVLISIHAL